MGGGGGVKPPQLFTWLPGFLILIFSTLGTSELMQIWSIVLYCIVLYCIVLYCTTQEAIVKIRLLRDKRIYPQVDHFMALWALSKSGVRWPSLRSSHGPIWCPPRIGLRADPISHFNQ